MLKGATPLLQRDRPLIFMLATKNILSSTFLSFFYDIIYMFMISIHSINHLKPFHFHLNSYKWWNYTLFVAVFVVTQTWPTFSLSLCPCVRALLWCYRRGGCGGGVKQIIFLIFNCLSSQLRRMLREGRTPLILLCESLKVKVRIANHADEINTDQTIATSTWYR